MSKRVRKPVFTFIATIMSLILLSGCIIHVGASKANANVEWGSDYSSVNKALTIDEGKSVGDVSAVNGRLTIKDNVSAEDISSVNGRLSLGKNVSAKDISTVNGKLSAESSLTSSGDVSSVNGSIKLKENSTVKGDLSTVNGTMDIDGVSIDKNIETVNGNIYLSGNTVVKGDIVYKWNKGNNKYKGNNPKLEIGANVRVEGSIILERPVNLSFADDSMNAKVIYKYKE